MASTIHNKSSLLNELQQHRSQIMQFDVHRLSLFGSFVRDMVNDNSDIDFFAESEQGKKTYDNFMDLSFFLEDLLGRRIELITPQSLNKHIGPYILRELEHVL